MGYITTVLGEIPDSRLGFCQCHEHLYLMKGRSFEINADLCIDDQDKSLEELALYMKAGGSAVVDAQPVGCGRDPAVLEAISRESGAHVIASTGFHKLMFYPDDHWIYTFDCDKLARLYISELLEGMYGPCDTSAPMERTSARAGQIKTALDIAGLTGEYHRLFTAAVYAAKETGRPLMVHIEKDSDPVGLADFLLCEGVEPEKVIFCHMDRSVGDIAVHKELCARGITMEYDTVARPKYHDDARETAIVTEMLESGYEDRILMSLDTTRARLKSYGGGMGLDYMLTSFIPRLREAGITGEALEKIFRVNPARIFSQ